MNNVFASFVKQLPPTNGLFWKQHHEFITPYALQDCLRLLQYPVAGGSLNDFKYQWRENSGSLQSKYLDFSFDNHHWRVSVGLVGSIESQSEQSSLVKVDIGLYYSNLYFFLAFVIIVPIFMSSGTHPNLLGSYFVSLLGHCVVILVIAFVIGQIAVINFGSASNQMIKDLKIVLKCV
jgi:hypothetical protein